MSTPPTRRADRRRWADCSTARTEAACRGRPGPSPWVRAAAELSRPAGRPGAARRWCRSAVGAHDAAIDRTTQGAVPRPRRPLPPELAGTGAQPVSGERPQAPNGPFGEGAGNPLLMKGLFESTAARAISYLQALPDRRVAPTAEAVEALQRFDEPLPEHPGDAERVIAFLDELGSPATMGTAGPRFFGFVIGGSHPVAVAAQLARVGVGPERRRRRRFARRRQAGAGRRSLADRALRACLRALRPVSSQGRRWPI